MRSTRRRVPNLQAGIASITLDSSPQLHAARRRLRNRNHAVDAWIDTGDAFTAAIRAFAHDLREP